MTARAHALCQLRTDLSAIPGASVVDVAEILQTVVDAADAVALGRVQQEQVDAILARLLAAEPRDRQDRVAAQLRALRQEAVDELRPLLVVAPLATLDDDEAPAIAHTQADCDERCHGCVHCYRRTGETVCDRLCPHAAENYPDGWPC